MDVEAEMHRAYIESLRLVHSALAPSATADIGDWFLVDAGVDNPEFNMAVVAGDPAKAARQVADVEGWYRDRGVDHCYGLRPGADAAVIEALVGRVKEAPRREPYMWRGVDGLGMSCEALRIERVRVAADLTAYDWFEAERGRPSEWSVAAAAVIEAPQCSLWLGWAGDEVAARSMAVATTPVGFITNVVVAERFRRRGFGRAITAAAGMACAHGGSSSVALGASRMGYPMYLAMGFEHRYDLAAYLRPQRALKS